MPFSSSLLEAEALRLYDKLKAFEYSKEDCLRLAETTLAITEQKRAKNAIILAHSYQTPDIVYGVADFVGDSYGLSVAASKTDAEIILFSSVLFMGETAKIVNPHKTVLVPARAGCSLADSINAADVRALRRQYPAAGFVAYINTTAEVKAEVDACCTSSNAHKVVEAMPEQQIVFLPDRLMGQNLRSKTTKDLILWDGTCIVHEEFSKKELAEVRREFPNARVIAHPECEPDVIAGADFVGSTEQMLAYLDRPEVSEAMMVTECGLADRAKSERPQKRIVGACHLCPYMKELRLKNILQALTAPRPDQVIEIPESLRLRAKRSIDRMFTLEQEYDERRK